MSNAGTPLQIAILLYPGVTALDVVGPWEVLSRLPDTEVRLVAERVGPVTVEGGGLLLGATHELSETPAPDVVVVPGGTTTPGQMVNDAILGWLREVHAGTTWTASVCTGALILGAAGLLKGLPATTHWYKLGALRLMGARPERDLRVVYAGRIVTAAGVSAGIDLALELAARLKARRLPRSSSCRSNTIRSPRSRPATGVRRAHACAPLARSSWTLGCPPINADSCRVSPGDGPSTSSAPVDERRPSGQRLLVAPARNRNSASGDLRFVVDRTGIVPAALLIERQGAVVAGNHRQPGTLVALLTDRCLRTVQQQSGDSTPACAPSR